MAFSVTNTPSDGDVLFAADYNENWTDVEEEFNSVTITSTSPWVRPKAGGTVTLTNTTTAFDVDKVDINFALNELSAGDMILVNVWAVDNDSGANINWRIDIDAVTTPQTLSPTGALATTAQTHGWSEVRLMQDNSENNQRVLGVFQGASSVTTTLGFNSVRTAATGDDNIFTTVWTLRLNFRYTSSITNSSTISYIVDVHRRP